MFVVALLIVGALLLTGDDDTEPPVQSGTGTGLATSTAGLGIVSGETPTVPSTVTQSPVAGQTTTPVSTPTSPGNVTPTPTSTEEADAEPTDVAAGEDEEPTPSDEVEDADSEPTEVVVEGEEPEPEPDDDTEPLIGDFGQLPPAQIVSGGLSRNLDFSYELDTSTLGAPQTALVYKLVWPERSMDDAQAMADSLQIGGAVEDLGGGNYQALGDSAELYIAPDVVQYVNLDGSAGGELEDDETLTSYAQDWLSSNGLISTTPGPASVIGRDEDANIAVVLVKPANPSPMLAFFPSASVTLAPGGVVQQANIQWPADYTPSEYGMKSLNEVWNRVVAGEGAVEADLSGVSGSGPVSGSFTVDEIGVGYSVASGSNGDFLVPLMVFYGTGFADTGETFPMSIYVPAVQGEVSAAG